MDEPSRSVTLQQQPTCCEPDASRSLFYVGTASGEVACIAAPSGDGTGPAPPASLQWTLSPQRSDPCRSLAACEASSAVYAGYAKHGVAQIDAERQSVVVAMQSEQAAHIHRLCLVSDAVLASGHDDGTVRLWDPRVPARSSAGAAAATCAAAAPAQTFAHQEDFISSLTAVPGRRALLATAGDGTLAVYDLRAAAGGGAASHKGGSRRAKMAKLLAVSEADDDERQCAAAVKGGAKVVTGTAGGVLELWSWGHFADCSDRYPGHPDSVEVITAFDDDTVLTAGGDGCVRVVNILPNKLLGVLGAHGGDEPVEGMALSRDKRTLATVAHDASVQLWSLAALHEDDSSSEGADASGCAAGVDTAAAAAAHAVEAAPCPTQCQGGEGQAVAHTGAVKTAEQGAHARTARQRQLTAEAGGKKGKRKRGPVQQGNFFADL